MAIKKDQHGNVVQAARPALSQTLTFSATSVTSAPFSVGPTGTYGVDGSPINTPNNTRFVRLVSTGNCWVVFGVAPVAIADTSLGMYLPANTPEYFWIKPAEQIAVVQDTAGGKLNIAEISG